ncbi:MAG TPA: class I SAM-dependent methyltransferase, partial [Actinomycetota bacterium]|nr:class I SAM-dependent methyltransferase [Actinomycetota bacterium]
MSEPTPDEPDRFAAWARDLGGWGIPDEILATAPIEPWHFPTKLFAHRAREQSAAPVGPSYQRAAEALPAGGSVLDVGSGAGAASLPLAAGGPGGGARSITAVDSDPEMLSALAELASGHPGLSLRLVTGSWPAVAPEVDPADVVVCHHVLYNTRDLRSFVEALTAHARRRVVVEVTEHHPLEPLNPLWERFWSLTRPAGPTAYDAAAAIASLGLPVTTEQRAAAPLHRYDSFEEMVAFHRRRLCLPASADPELGEALI